MVVYVLDYLSRFLFFITYTVDQVQFISSCDLSETYFELTYIIIINK